MVGNGLVRDDEAEYSRFVRMSDYGLPVRSPDADRPALRAVLGIVIRQGFDPGYHLLQLGLQLHGSLPKASGLAGSPVADLRAGSKPARPEPARIPRSMHRWNKNATRRRHPLLKAEAKRASIVQTARFVAAIVHTGTQCRCE